MNLRIRFNGMYKTMNQAMISSHYNPAQLLDALLRHLQLNSDSALSRRLKVAKRVILDIRHGRMPIGGSMLLWMQDTTGISVKELRNWLGDRRTTCRLAFAHRPSMVLAG